MMRPSLAWTIFVATSGMLVLLFLTPLWLVIRGGFFVEGEFTLKYLLGVFQNPIYAEGLFNSLMLAVGTTTIVTLIAVPLAWLSNRYDFPGKSVLSGLVLVPMILPPFVGAIGFQQILGQYGALNVLLGIEFDWLGRAQYFGVILLQALALYPIMYLNVTAALANVDPAMEEAAENLGCSGCAKVLPDHAAADHARAVRRRHDRLHLELHRTRHAADHELHAVRAGAGLRRAEGDRHEPVSLRAGLRDAGDAALRCTRSASFSLAARRTPCRARRRPPRPREAGRGWRAVRVPLLFGLVILVALLPHFGVVATSLRRAGKLVPQRAAAGIDDRQLRRSAGALHDGQQHPQQPALFQLGGGVQRRARHRHRLRGRPRSTSRCAALLDALAMLPLAVPGLVMAFGYLALSSQLSNLEWVKDSPFWQNLFDVRTNPTLFLVIAYAVRRLPYMVRSAVAGLQQTSVTLEEAAANSGRRTDHHAAPHHAAADHRQPDRRRPAGLLLQHARGVGQPDAGPAPGLLSDHQDHLRAVPADRHGQVHRLRAGRVGDGLPRRHDSRQQLDTG